MQDWVLSLCLLRMMAEWEWMCEPKIVPACFFNSKDVSNLILGGVWMLLEKIGV